MPDFKNFIIFSKEDKRLYNLTAKPEKIYLFNIK